MRTAVIVGSGPRAAMLQRVGQELGLAVRLVDEGARELVGVAPGGVTADGVAGFEADAGEDRVEVATAVWPWTDGAGLRALEDVGLVPGHRLFALAEDRFEQRETLRQAGLRVPETAPVHTLDDLRRAADRLGFPVVLRARHPSPVGLDRLVVPRWEEMDAAWLRIGRRPLIAEVIVPEASALSVTLGRAGDGRLTAYPIAELVERAGDLDLVRVPATIPEAAVARVLELASKAVVVAGAVGVATVCLSMDAAGGLAVVELVPGVHEAADYSLDACVTSQYEQHWRGLLGLPFGSVRMTAAAAVTAVVRASGGRRPDPAAVAAALALSAVKLHWYGRRPSRPGRVLGHVTAVAADVTTATEFALSARFRLGRVTEAESRTPP